MCCNRARSDGGILHLGGSKHIVPEVAAQIFGRAEVYGSADDRLELELHARQRKESRCLLGLEFDQDIDITLGPESVRQHRSEQRKALNAVPPAEVSDKIWIELNLGRHRSRL
jgi:hypothetical protein